METLAQPVFDEFAAAEYDSRLYSPDNVATGVISFGDVTDELISYYRENGFLVIQRAFTQMEVSDALNGLMDLIDGKCPDFTDVQLERSVAKELVSMSVEDRRDSVRKIKNFIGYEPRLRALSEKPEFLDVVARLVGSSTELFADQALIKPPRIGREKPWHQDHAFFNLPMGTPIAGCWIALDQSTFENGCMHVKPRSHSEGPKIHFKQRDWQICDSDLDLDRDVVVPLEPGGLLFFDGLTHHGTPANKTSQQRRAVQFHYIPEGTPRIQDEHRMSVFGSEGKNVTC